MNSLRYSASTAVHVFCLLTIFTSLVLLPFGEFWWARWLPSLMGCAAGTAAVRRSPAFAPIESPLMLWGIALAVVALVQLVIGITIVPETTLHLALDGIGLCGLLLAIEAHPLPVVIHERWIVRLVAAGMILCLAGAVLHLSWPTRAYGVWETKHIELWGPFANRNNFAVLAGLLIPLSMALAARSVRRGLWFVLAVVVTGSVAASGSRTGAAVLLAEWTALGVLFYQAGIVTRARLGGMAACTLAGLVVVFPVSTLVSRLQLMDFSSTRGVLYRSAIETIGRNGWFGSGLGSFAAVYPGSATTDFGALVDHAHNDWLEWAVEGGVALPVLVAALLAWQLWRVRQPAVVLSAAALLASSLLDYPFHRPLFGFFCAGFLAAMCQGVEFFAIDSETSGCRKDADRSIPMMGPVSGERDRLQFAPRSPEVEFPANRDSSVSA